jgi:hypothetical protein
MENAEKSEALAFVTKKALVTFAPHMRIGLPIKGAVLLVETAIIEYDVPEGAHREGIPSTFRVVALSNGQKISKSLNVRVPSYGGGGPHALVELSEEDFDALMRQG